VVENSTVLCYHRKQGSARRNVVFLGETENALCLDSPDAGGERIMDELLIRRAQGGDPEAFEQLMTPMEGLIWRVCWHYTGNREASEDCGQEAMVKIWRNLKGYRGDCTFESWVYRIAANCCLDYLRRKKRDRSESIEPLREQGFDPADPGAGTEDTVLAAEDQRRLREAIGQLPEDQREALVLTQLEGISYEEAASMMGTTEGTMKSRVNRAKAKLKEWLSEPGDQGNDHGKQKNGETKKTTERRRRS